MSYEEDDSLQWHPRYDSDGDFFSFVDGYRAAEHDLAEREQAVADRERIVSQLDRDTKLYMAEQEERHRRTLEVMDAEVDRLTGELAAMTQQRDDARCWWPK